MTKCTFHVIKPRHYSLFALEERLGASVDLAELDLDANPKKDIWYAEAAILEEMDCFLDHVKFSLTPKSGSKLALKVVGTAKHTQHINRIYTIED